MASDHTSIVDEMDSAEVRKEYRALHWSSVGNRRTPPPDPVISENTTVANRVALTAALRRIGALRLLDAQLNYERLFSSANPPGAATPEVARGCLTRQAKKDAAARQRANRALAQKGHQRAFQQLLKACA